MKRTKIILAVILAFTLTACSDANTAEVTEEITESSVSETASEVTTAEATTTEETTATETTEEINEEDSVRIDPPGGEFLLMLFNSWKDYIPVESGADYNVGSPAGTAAAFYTDIDGDFSEEFCYILDSNHGSMMYICKYEDGDWKVKDAIRTVKEYTFIQTEESGAQHLLVVNAIPAADGLERYTYVNGKKQFLDFKGAEYAEKIIFSESGDFDEYYSIIDKGLEEFDNLTRLYDLPHAETSKLYDICNPDYENGGEEALDKFTDDTAVLFKEEKTAEESEISSVREDEQPDGRFDFVINGGGFNKDVIKEMNEIPPESGLKQCEFKNTDIDNFTALYRQHHMLPDGSNENELIWFWNNEFYFTVGETDYLYLASTTENCGMLYNLTANAEYELTRVGEGKSFISGDENGVYLVTYTEGALWLGETVFDLTMGEKISENSFVYDTPEQEHELSSEMQYYSSLVPYIEFNLE